MTPNATQQSALSRLFSSAVFREIAEKGRSAQFARLLLQSGISPSPTQSVGEVFDTAFSILRKNGLRDEYVYRSALTQNILLGTHSLRTACLLTEFRAGTCKADLAILNGTASVYEIKSERDSLSRLHNQIENYQKVFSKVFVIAADRHVSEVVAQTSQDVGVLALTHRNQITIIRNAVDRPDLVCPVTIFESLRSDEARQILTEHNISIPDVPNTQLRRVMRKSFSELDAESTLRSMVRVLKKSRSLMPLQEFVSKLPRSLQSAALTTSIRSYDQQRLVEALSTPILSAMEWT